jgi:ABC-type phosphate/phosphonate transport system permease subunit
MADSIAITDSIALTLNDVNTLFKTLSDSASMSDSISPAWQPVLTDTLSFSESIAFTLYLTINETFVITEDFPHITGLLFGFESITDTMAYSDVVASEERDSVFETGDYGTSDVFVHTDLVNIGVFE